VVEIYDEKEVSLVADPKTDLLDSPALWSKNSSFIALAQSYFDNLWITAMKNPNREVVKVSNWNITKKDLPQIEQPAK
jgi:hypothetical protein